MKLAETYKNKFPLEPLIPRFDEKEAHDFVNNCDYTIECNKICDNMGQRDLKINTADAVEFYRMGYESAKTIIEGKLEPI